MSLDDQRFRARLAALDAAERMLGGPVPAIISAAEAFETWLIRPEPLADLPGPAVGPRTHVPTTKPTCSMTWRNENGSSHACQWLPAHHVSLGHVCSCGERPAS